MKIVTRLFLFAFLALSFQNCKNPQPGGTSGNPQTMKGISKEKGPSFKCVGTEPFWYVKIEPDSGIVYNQMDEGITRYPYQMPRQEGSKTIFETSVGESKIKIVIEPGQCSDGMSDEIFPYTCKVEKDKTMLSGCAK